MVVSGFEPVDVLQLAISLEVQAYDLYSRMAQKSNDESSKALFLKIVNEEKGHIALLSKELDKVI
mgnify:CR=1 FL=1